MTRQLKNELGRQIIRALGLDPNDYTAVTLTSEVGQLEHVTLTMPVIHRIGGADEMQFTVTEKWAPVEHIEPLPYPTARQAYLHGLEHPPTEEA